MTHPPGEDRVEKFYKVREHERTMPLSSGQLWTGEDVDLILTRLREVEGERDETKRRMEEMQAGRCISCPVYSRAADMWDALLQEKKVKLAQAEQRLKEEEKINAGHIREINSLRERASAAEYLRDTLRFELDGLDLVRKKDNAYLIQRAEQAEQRITDLQQQIDFLHDQMQAREQRVEGLEADLLTHKDDRTYWAHRCHEAILKLRELEAALKKIETLQSHCECWDISRAALTPPQPAPKGNAWNVSNFATNEPAPRDPQP